MKITEYTVNTSKPIPDITFACVSDLHARGYEKVIAALKSFEMDAILLAGDILEVSNEYMSERNKSALEFLEKASQIAPVYYCFGNHEIYYSHTKKECDRVSNNFMLQNNIEKIRSFGIHIVNDCFEAMPAMENKILIGGLVCGRDMDPALDQKLPDLDFIKAFDDKNDFKILLCHYPHYYQAYLKDTQIDLILSGHAHGGQWRLFGRGIYSPHQGLFPKYTSGIYNGRFIISRGAVNNSKPIPRFFNPTEILKIKIRKK